MTWRDRFPASVRDRLEINTVLMKRLLADAAAAIPRGSLVLDAGAGEGRFRDLFLDKRYVGVDLAVGDVTWDYSGISAVDNLQSLCFADNTFDAAVCTVVLEHVSEPEQVLREIARVLKPGGKLLLVAPQSWHEHQIPYDFYRYTSYGLTYLLGKAGLTVEQMTPLGGYFLHLAFQLRMLPYWVFSRNRRGHSLGPLALPVKAASVGLFEIALPLLLQQIDPIDQIQEATLGHFCLASKPHSVSPDHMDPGT
jgi:SAM-dependent methyltransferase